MSTPMNRPQTQPEAQEETRKRTIIPASSIWREDGKIMVRVEMPGVTKDDLDVQVEGDTLRITGRRETAPKDAELIVCERRNADYSKTFTLDDSVDRSNIEADMEQGVLTLTLHLKESEKPRKIQVKSG